MMMRNDTRIVSILLVLFNGPFTNFNIKNVSVTRLIWEIRQKGHHMNYTVMGVIFKGYYFIGTPLTSTKLPSISFISIPSSCCYFMGV